MNTSRGFTLIELMIVVAIIAIISALAITVYSASVAKSQLTEAITIADGLKTAVTEYQHEAGSCPVAGQGNVLSPTSYAGRFVAKAVVTGGTGPCVITATMKSTSVASQIQGKTVSLTMIQNTGANGMAMWKCTSTAASIYLPATCR